MNNFIDKLENKKGLIIIVIFLLVLSIASGTFAFWNWSSADTERTDVVIEVPDICIVSVDGGGEFNSSMANIVPATCTNSNNAIIREITVNVELIPEEGAATTVNLWLKKDSIAADQSYLDTANFRYALTTSPTSCTSNLVASGTFHGVSVGSDIELLKKVYRYEGQQNVTETFYLYIWLDAAETDISTAGKHFNIVMDADCSNYEEIITLSYDLDGGSGNFPSQTFDNSDGAGATYKLPTTVPTKASETFLGWSTSNDGTVDYNPGDTVTLTKSTKLYAIWQVNDVNVTYIANLFSNVKTKTINGLTISYDKDTSYLTLNGTPTSNTGIATFGDFDFVAGEQYKLDLIFVSGSVSVVDDGHYQFQLEVKKDNNNTALSTRNAIGIKMLGSDSYNKVLTISDVSASEGNVLYSRIYTESSGDVTFNNYVVKVVVTKVNTVTTPYGGNYLLPANPVRDGYTFTGWYTAETGGTQVTSSTKMNSTIPHEIYAQWRLNKVYIQFHANGGSLTDGSGSSVYTLSNNYVYRDGSRFYNTINYGDVRTASLQNYNYSAGYVISKDGNTTNTDEEYICSSGCTVANKVFSQSDETYTSNDFCDARMSDCTVTLKVNWVPITYKIDYNVCSGQGTPSTQTKTHGTTLTLSSTKPTRSGYTFKGWSTASSCSAATSATYQAGASYTDEGDKTLYAVWQDSTNPTCTIAATANNTKLTATYKDDAGVVGYYFGKTKPTTSTSFTSQSSKTSGTTTGTVSSAGTYYFGYKDVNGNVGYCSGTSSATTSGTACRVGWVSGVGCYCSSSAASCSLTWDCSSAGKGYQTGSCSSAPYTGCTKTTTNGTYTCSSGTLSGTTCYVAGCTTTTYSCSSGTKLSDSYCWK